MFCCIYFIFLNYYCLCAEEDDVYIEINDNTFEVDRLFYGDLTDISEMFLPPLDAPDIDSDEEQYNETVKPLNLNFDYIQPTELGIDVNEFNEVTKLLNNATRRWNGWYYGWNDVEEPRSWWHIEDMASEMFKKEKMVNINLQHLIHARYQVKKAILKKQIIRTDKRYRIGYLFNRLKRIKYEQQKIVNTAKEQMDSRYPDLTSQMKLYEKIVRYDVDITDTIKHIKEIDKETGKMILIPEMTMMKMP